MATFAVNGVAIPFRVGWGFSRAKEAFQLGTKLMSQSLSGWDGVFHLRQHSPSTAGLSQSQSLSGWDGVFHILKVSKEAKRRKWCRNPFQGGMGFFTGDA